MLVICLKLYDYKPLREICIPYFIYLLKDDKTDELLLDKWEPVDKNCTWRGLWYEGGAVMVTTGVSLQLRVWHKLSALK